MRSHVTVLIILGILTLLTMPGQSDADVINACKNDRSGTLRIVDDVAECRSSESPLSWNTEGPQGEQGEPGPPGGFDVSKLYVVTCDEESECQCEDRGGRHFISGSVNCDLCENSTQASLSTTTYYENTKTFEAFCNCADLDPPVSHYTVPLYIQLICYDNSEYDGTYTYDPDVHIFLMYPPNAYFGNTFTIDKDTEFSPEFGTSEGTVFNFSVVHFGNGGDPTLFGFEFYEDGINIISTDHLSPSPMDEPGVMDTFGPFNLSNENWKFVIKNLNTNVGGGIFIDRISLTVVE